MIWSFRFCHNHQSMLTKFHLLHNFTHSQLTQSKIETKWSVMLDLLTISNHNWACALQQTLVKAKTWITFIHNINSNAINKKDPFLRWTLGKVGKLQLKGAMPRENLYLRSAISLLRVPHKITPNLELLWINSIWWKDSRAEFVHNTLTA